MAQKELIRRIGHQMEEAFFNDLLVRNKDGETTMYDVDLVQQILKEFMMSNQDSRTYSEACNEIQEVRKPWIVPEASKLIVDKLVDRYLAQIAKDSNLTSSTFVDLAEMVAAFPRPAHDGLYCAFDTFLKAHPRMSKSERKIICRLMDYKKFSGEACIHAVQNDRLSFRVVVQVLFFEQVRANASSGSSTPNLPHKAIDSTSYGSSRYATTTEDDCDAVAST